MDRKITCVNADNVGIVLTSNMSPWMLSYADGLYSVSNKINAKDKTMADGSTYIGMVAKKRNIVLTLKENGNHVDNRNELYNVFKPKVSGTLTYKEGEEVRKIDYYVESINIDSIKPVRTATVSLLCPDPFFRDEYDTEVVMSGWEPMFQWEHEFKDEGEIFGLLYVEKLKDIDNMSGADNIGLTITISASDTVTNPKVLKFETGEYIQVGTEDNPFTMVAGDVLTITTLQGNKNVRLNHEGVITNVNQYLEDNSVYIQLDNGVTKFRYSSDVGEDYMIVTISYRNRYLGV